MAIPFFRNKQYAFTGDSDWSMIGEKIIGPTGQLSLQTLSWAKNSLNSEKTIHHLLAGSNITKGEISISLPLNFFETVSLSINKIPDETVGRVLPYHLAKNFDHDLTNFLYDWIITKRQKETLQITVFLFPLKAFETITGILNHHKLSCTTLEPDIFSVTAYLETCQRLPQNEATLCAILWSNSMSIMVYDSTNIMLARNINLSQPSNIKQKKQSPAPEKVPTATGEENLQSDSEAILANFLIMTRDDTTENNVQPPHQNDDETPPANAPQSASWENYCSLVGLEMMRTRDYFNSIIKGNPINKVIIGGAELCWDKLTHEIEENIGRTPEPIIDIDIGLTTSPSLMAMGIGILCKE